MQTCTGLESGRKCRASAPFLCGVKAHHRFSTSVCSPIRKLHRACVQSFELGFHSLGAAGYVIRDAAKSSQHEHHPVIEWHPLIVWQVFLATSPHPTASRVYRDSPHQHHKDTPVTQEIPRVLEAHCQEPSKLLAVPQSGRLTSAGSQITVVS